MAIFKISQECTPKTLSPRLYKTLSHKSAMPTATNPSSIPKHIEVNMLRNKTFSSLGPSYSHSHSHKASQHPQSKNNQKSFNILDRYSKQIRLQREQEEKIERLNKKYNLDCFSSSELDSESDEEEDYKYEHKYKTLI